MRRKHNYHTYRRPRTAQEKRANQDTQYVRGRRHACNIVDRWDDNVVCVQKTWKIKRLTQYRVGSRGKEHYITIDGKNKYCLSWNLEQYFEKHDIPYQVEPLYKTKTTIRYYQHEYRLIKYIPYLCVANKLRTIGTFMDLVKRDVVWEPLYKWVVVPFAEPRTYKQSYLIGFSMTWWSNKDIGIDYILRQAEHYA